MQNKTTIQMNSRFLFSGCLILKGSLKSLLQLFHFHRTRTQ
ncbi:hypothetical protein [Wielerella bovis]|nr:hypothetical protein [Wielerella bovis]